ncbi:SDR family oxidoreductase [Proteiniclasticum sp. BAD-10]|uniref:SDR family oxidoreductase n=1 Tax=Proteiniclasticum sediminis TaxID=2804028 RepID=A0A941HPJ8_9CLOT|nr:SDR family oxidoreductase [Proteiniclasticum sediminis]MBR0575125.1 SDR family oxidoreductase [Proteiniclasticum sediminis]
MDLGLEGKVALVIASSQGLGKACARELVKEGCHVMLTSRNEEKLEAAARELAELHRGRVSHWVCDITKPQAIRELVKYTHKVYGKIDILINNSGGPPTGTFDDLTDEDWMESFQLNLLSYIRIIRETLPYLKAKGGRIVNLASISVKTPLPGLILSNTFRSGVVGLSKTLAEELAPYQILVNVVAPGQIATDRIKSLNADKARRLELPLETVEKDALGKIPLGRYGTPEEFGKAVAFLVSEANTYITGSTLLLDGGMAKVL